MKTLLKRVLVAVAAIEIAVLLGAGAYAAGYVHGMYDTERATRTVLATKCERPSAPVIKLPSDKSPPVSDRIWL